MATRVNTKFVIILVAAVVVLSGTAFVGYQLIARRDPGRYINRAAALETQAQELGRTIAQLDQRVDQLQRGSGEADAAGLAEAREELAETREQRNEALLDAARQLHRAKSVESDGRRRIEILMERAAVLRQVRTSSMNDVRHVRVEMLRCWNEALDIDPGHPEAARKLLNAQYEVADTFSGLGNWTQLYNAADELLDFDDQNELARRYRGMAQVARAERLNLNPREREEARTDLEAAFEAAPDDGELAYFLARWHLVEATAQADASNPQAAEEHRERASSLMQQFVEAHPDDPAARLHLTQVEMRRARLERDAERFAGALETLGRVEDLVDPATQPRLAIQIARYLAEFDTTPVEGIGGVSVRSGLARAEALLRRVVEHHPDRIAAVFLLGDVLKQQQRIEAAIAQLQRAGRDLPLGPDARSFLEAEMRLQAIKDLAGLYLSQRERSSDEAERRAYLAKAQAQAARLADIVGEDTAAYQMVRGHIALVEGQTSLAVKHLQAADTRYDGSDPETLILLAGALQRNGETGAAAATYEKLLGTPKGGRLLQPHLELAKLRLQTGQRAQALALLERVLRFQPDNVEARLLKARAEIQSGDAADPAAAVEQAMQTIDALGESEDSRVAIMKAELHRAAGEIDKAIALVEQRYEAHPDELRTLQYLVRLYRAAGQEAKANQRLVEAAEANPDNQLLQLMRSAAEGDADLVAQVENLVGQTENELERHLKLWTLYRRLGETEKAAAALARAERVAPDHEQVLSARFEAALQAEDWAAAERIVERVAAMNEGEGIDYAGGEFWRGQLLLMRGAYAEAARAIERGLERMPTSSRGHLMLGRARMALDDYSAAERAIQRALELKPDRADAWLLMHRIHDRLGQHAQALGDLEQARRFEPNNAALYRRYLAYVGEHGDVQEAIEARRRIAENRPDDQANQRELARLLLRAEQPAEAKRILDQLMAEAPEELANVAALAEYHRRTGDFETGRSTLLEFVHSREQPTVEHWLALARYLREGGAVDQAEAAYRQAVALEDARTMPVTRELADWLFRRGEFAKAAQQYAGLFDAVRDQPEARPGVVHRRYTEALLRAERTEAALRQTDALIEADPRDAQAHLLRALALQQRYHALPDSAPQRENLLVEVQAAYQRAIDLAPDSPDPLVQRARFRLNSGDPDLRELARDDLRQAIRLDPGQVGAQVTLSQLHLQEGDMAGAIAPLEQLLNVRPDLAPARERLAELYLQAGNKMPELEALLANSIQRMPEDPTWYELRGRMYMRQNRLTEASRNLVRAYQLNPSPQHLVQLTEFLLDHGQARIVLSLLSQNGESVRSSAMLQALEARALGMAGQSGEAASRFQRLLGRALADDDAPFLGQAMNQAIAGLPPDRVLALIEPLVDQDPTGVLKVGVAQLQMMQGRDALAMTQLVNLEGELSGAMEQRRLGLLAQIHHLGGEPERARRIYERIIEIDPDNFTALNNLAYLLTEDLDRPADALPLAQRALAASSQNPTQRASVLDTLGLVQYRLGRLTEAEQSLRQSIAFNPLVDNRIHLAQVLMQQDRPDAARDELIAARQLAEETENRDAVQRIENLMASIDATAASLQR